jgi:hypothetical protein
VRASKPSSQNSYCSSRRRPAVALFTVSIVARSVRAAGEARSFFVGANTAFAEEVALLVSVTSAELGALSCMMHVGSLVITRRRTTSEGIPFDLGLRLDWYG